MVKDEGETRCEGRKRVRKEEEISKGGEKMESIHAKKSKMRGPKSERWATTRLDNECGGRVMDF